MTKYQEMKETIRQQALDYDLQFSNGVNFGWSEIAKHSAYFEKMGKRYGLLTEFRENGII